MSDDSSEILERFSPDKALNILWVCSGNICRSAYADFVFNKMVEDSPILSKIGLKIHSGGLQFKNLKIDPRTVDVLVKEGFDEAEVNKHIPRYKKDYPEMLEEADLIVGMSHSHKLLTPKKYRDKFLQISKWAIGERVDIPDPYFVKTDAEYAELLAHVKEYLEIIRKKLEDFYSKKK
jgi:protein-tyrosine-phosphatase